MWIRIRNPDAHIGQYHWLSQETFTLMLKLVQVSNPAGAIGVNLAPAAPRVAGSLCSAFKRLEGTDGIYRYAVLKTCTYKGVLLLKSLAKKV